MFRYVRPFGVGVCLKGSSGVWLEMIVYKRHTGLMRNDFSLRNLILERPSGAVA
jgi:hypothetical protein